MTNLNFQDIPIIENHDPMVDLAVYPFILEPAYFNCGLSPHAQLYTRRAIANNLVELQEGILAGYIFKIWDPWRPRNVQANIYWKYWNELRAKNPAWDEAALRREVGIFVSAPESPGRIPPHATGGAIDLTLAVRSDGRELDMGTGFDHFGPEAAPDYFETAGRNEKIRDNRRIFHGAMKQSGFTIDKDEWWHFDYGNQIWALKTGAPYAFYGEILRPNPVA